MGERSKKKSCALDESIYGQCNQQCKASTQTVNNSICQHTQAQTQLSTKKMKTVHSNRYFNGSIRSRKSRGFLWSLNPIFSWMQFIGFELNCSVWRSNWRCVAAVGFGLLLLTLNLLISVTQCTAKVWQSPTSVWVNVLVEFNVAFYSVALYLAFLMAVRSHWKKLFDKMQQIERSFALNRSILYKACRKVSIAGMVFFTVVIYLNGKYNQHSEIWVGLLQDVLINIRRPSPHWKIGNAGDASQLFDPSVEEMSLLVSRNVIMASWSIQILFSILVRHVTIIFAGLNRQMEVILCPDNSMRLVAMKLETWRHNHVLVCQMVHCISECFGLVLLISMGHHSISLIVLSYEMYEDFHEYFVGNSPGVGYRPFVTVLLMARHLVHLILIVFIPCQMQKEVRIYHHLTILPTLQLFI